MARPIRIERAGGWYHVTARGNERKPIFRDDRDYLHFYEVMAEMVVRFRVRLHCFVLMQNHYHLVIELTEPVLSRAIQWLNVSYSVWFNRRHGRTGHLFQGRFKSVIVSPEEWGLELSRYVHLNPVRIGKLGLGKKDRQRSRLGFSEKPDAAKIKERLRLLRQFRWSSYRAYIGVGKGMEWLDCGAVLKLGGGKAGEQQENYRKYVENAIREGLERSPWDEIKEQAVLGSERFLHKIRHPVSGGGSEQRRARKLAMARPSLKQVIQCVEKLKEAKWDSFRDAHGDNGRDLVLHFGQRVCGLKLADLAREVGLKDYAAAGMAAARFRKRLDFDEGSKKQIKQVCQMLNV